MAMGGVALGVEDGWSGGVLLACCMSWVVVVVVGDEGSDGKRA